MHVNIKRSPFELFNLAHSNNQETREGCYWRCRAYPPSIISIIDNDDAWWPNLRPPCRSKKVFYNYIYLITRPASQERDGASYEWNTRRDAVSYPFSRMNVEFIPSQALKIHMKLTRTWHDGETHLSVCIPLQGIPVCCIWSHLSYSFGLMFANKIICFPFLHMLSSTDKH